MKAPTSTPTPDPAWPPGAGEMVDRIRSTDWAATPLGPVSAWHAALRTAVELMLESPIPVSVLWGPRHIQLYNDAYAPIAGERHPLAFGRPAEENWPDIFPNALRPLFECVLAGRPQTIQDYRIRLDRPDGAGTEERSFTAAFTPLRDPDGEVCGIFHPLLETTAQVALRESEERFRSFAEASEDVLWMVDAHTRQLEYVSPAFARVWGEPREHILRDITVWSDRIHPDDVPQPGEGIEALFAGRGYIAEYRIVRRDGGVRYIHDTGFPIFDDAGRVRRVAGVAQDLTERRLAQQALADSEYRARTLVEGIPHLVWRGELGGYWTWASPQWSAFTGQPEPDSRGRGWMACLHPDDRDRALSAWEDAEHGNGFVVDYRIREQGRDYRWFRTISRPVRDEAGEIAEWIGTSTDVDELYRLQKRQGLLLAELQHRVRNTLGVVRSIVRRTAQTSDNVEEMAGHLQGRLSAFSRVQTALTRTEDAAIPLIELIEDELLAHATREGEALRIRGPDLALSPRAAEGLSLAVHELTSNAVKYGALSHDGARVHISWDVTGSDGARRLRFEWQELGVPAPPSAPRRQGFGLELLERQLPYELDAVTSAEFLPTGFRFTLDMPLE